jgi:26S proteasome regulatory subunit N10
MITSPILQPDNAGAGAAGGDAAANNGDPLAAMGIDPNMDPELAMAIRLSMEEAKAAEEPAAEANPEPE